MAHFIKRTKGFGVMLKDTLPSHYAETMFGPFDCEPRSRLKFSLVKKDLLENGKNRTMIDDPCFNHVVNSAFDVFKLEKKVQPIHLNDLFFMKLDCRQSSPGLPWQPMYKTRGEVMDDPAARNSIRWFWHRVKDGQDLGPPASKVLYRAHLKKDGSDKIRAVYGYPTTMTLGEAMFALPLMEEYKKGTTPIAYGYDMATGGAYRLRNQIKKYKHFSCFDFSRFDKTVSKQLIKIAFRILMSNIDFTSYRESGVPDARRLLNAWDYIEKYFLETPMLLSNGELWSKKAGVPSGSFFTQLIDSIVNWIILTYAIFKTTGRFPEFMRVLGDDSVIASSFPLSKYKIAEVVESVGMEISTSKGVLTTNVDEVEFLGFVIANGFPQRDYSKWMAQLYNPEYPDRSWDDFASRALGLFYACHGVNGQFSETCRRVIGYQSFSIHLSRDMTRFLSSIGVAVNQMSTLLPSDQQLLFSLML